MVTIITSRLRVVSEVCVGDEKEFLILLLGMFKKSVISYEGDERNEGITEVCEVC